MSGKRTIRHMSLGDLEAKITQHLAVGTSTPLPKGSLGTGTDANKLYVIKYTARKFVSDILTTQSLYASKTPGYTWEEAVYVAPLTFPRSNMMYGAAGIIGLLDAAQLTFFDAVDPSGIAYYQDWITYFPPL